jgi:dihydrofolate reductase
MRKIITTTFITLDGVLQGPGGPEEDTSNGFKYGGWQMGWDEKDEIADRILDKFLAVPFELLLGRRTYDIFASYWPNHPEITSVATPFNSTKKYVVSHKSVKLSWNNSELIKGNVVTKIKKLKKIDGPDLWVWGSGNLIQTLLKHNLIDQMHIFIYPITIGTGKKLFAEGARPQRFKPVDSKITSTGVVFATYEPSAPLKKATL